MKRFASWFALVLVIGFCARASAQPGDEPSGAPTIGDAGHWSLSLERAFGFDYMKETQSMGGVDQQTNSATSFSLFSNPLSAAFSAFSFPRAGFDVFVAPGLSVGTSLGVFHATQSSTPVGGSETTQSLTGVVVTPRIGYVAHLAPSISFWPRAGISIIYASTSASLNGADLSATSHLLAGTVEAPFVFTVAPRVAFTFGPTLDISFSGGTSQTLYGMSATVDQKVLEIGAQAGLVVTL